MLIIVEVIVFEISGLTLETYQLVEAIINNLAGNLMHNFYHNKQRTSAIL